MGDSEATEATSTITSEATTDSDAVEDGTAITDSEATEATSPITSEAKTDSDAVEDGTATTDFEETEATSPMTSEATTESDAVEEGTAATDSETTEATSPITSETTTDSDGVEVGTATTDSEATEATSSMTDETTTSESDEATADSQTETVSYTYTYTYGSTGSGIETTEVVPEWILDPSRGTPIGFDLENIPVEIRTDSNPESRDQIRISFFTEGKGKPSGNLKIKFDERPKYFIENCMVRAIEFEDPLADEDERVWRVTETDEGIIVFCNGVVVLNYKFKDADKAKACIDMWSENTEVMEFHSQDTASDAYRPARMKVKKTKKNRKRAKGKRKGKKKDKGSKDIKDDETTMVEATETPVDGTGTTDASEYTYTYTYTFGSTGPTEVPAE